MEVNNYNNNISTIIYKYFCRKVTAIFSEMKNWICCKSKSQSYFAIEQAWKRLFIIEIFHKLLIVSLTSQFEGTGEETAAEGAKDWENFEMINEKIKPSLFA